MNKMMFLPLKGGYLALFRGRKEKYVVVRAGDLHSNFVLVFYFTFSPYRKGWAKGWDIFASC